MAADAVPDPARSKTPVMVVLDSIARPGGGERLAIEGIVRIDPQRFDRSLCLTRWSDAFLTEEPARSILTRLDDAGVEVIGLGRTSRFSLRPWLGLVRRLRRERDGVVHGHLFGSNFWAAALGTFAGVRAIVAHEHMWSYSGSRLRPLIDRFVIARLADAFVAVSGFGLRQMVDVERIPERDVVLIRNGAPPLGAGDRASTRTSLGVGPETTVIGSVGHLRAEKAYEVLVEAGALLSRAGHDIRIVVAGEGPERNKLEDLARDLGIRGRVSLLGNRSDIGDLLAAFDVAVCCSDFEGGPLSVIEYMEAGLPVVATDVGGVPEMVEHARTGLLVPPRDPGAIADAVASLIETPDTARGLGARGRASWAANYDIDVWVRRIEDLYERLLEEG